MIRKIIIMVLTLGAVGTLCIGGVGAIDRDTQRWLRLRPSETEFVILQSSSLQVRLTACWKQRIVAVPHRFRWGSGGSMGSINGGKPGPA